MPDDEFRREIVQQAQDAVEERLGDESDGSGRGVLTPTEIIDRDWDVSEYNDFFADCRTADYSPTECGEMWSALKDAGIVESREQPSTTDDAESGEGGIFLLVKEGTEASDIAATHLAEPIMEGEMDIATVGSDEGQGLIESAGGVSAVPAHLHVTDDGVEERELKELFREFLVE